MKKVLLRMKKYIISGVVLMGTGLVSLVLGRLVDVENESALTLDNIEALTSGDVQGTDGTKTEVCYVDINFEKEDSRVANTYYCGDCKEVPYTTRVTS